KAQNHGVAGKLLSRLDRSKHQTAKAREGRQGSDQTTAWIHNHCDFLHNKPRSAKDLLKDLKSIPEKMAKDLGIAALEAAKNKMQAELTELIQKKVTEVIAKKAAGRLAVRAASVVTGPFAIVINIAMTAYDAYDLPKTWDQVKNSFPDKVKQIEETARKLQEATAKVNEMKDALAKYSGDDQNLAADVMQVAAELNPCIRARRCSLVPYGNTHRLDHLRADCNNIGEEQNPVNGPDHGKGCCPGQSGHHVLPASMFDHCEKYKKTINSPPGTGCVNQLAPTICVEGTNQYQASHGHIHGKLSQVLRNARKGNGQPIPDKGPMTKDEAIDAGAESIVLAFPSSGCSKKCLKAQLRAFYKDLDCQPISSDGLGKPPRSGPTTPGSSTGTPPNTGVDD
ncbi:HNH/endonuclease VII fold toxin-2 domain-containing protein, partial [Chitinimonas lacunae]